jgi:peptidoglycan-N-acetylglucosamine deacetylase
MPIGMRTRAAHDSWGKATGLLGTALGLYWAPGLCAVSPAVRGMLGVADSIVGRHAVALTFDDGPHPEGTPAVLELLARHGARAAFFLAGEQAERMPELAAAIAAGGHEVGVHCHRHRNLLRLTPRQVSHDLARAAAAIAESAGQEPRLYRPPFGVLNAAALLTARRRGWTPLLWTRWGRDWLPGAYPAGIAALLTRDVCPGDVLLLHDADHYSAPGSWRRTLAALPLVLDELRCRGLEPTLP